MKVDYPFLMSTYWNKIVLDKLFKKYGKKDVKYKLSTKIGRFYFYFEKETENEKETTISGKIVFFPNFPQ